MNGFVRFPRASPSYGGDIHHTGLERAGTVGDRSGAGYSSRGGG